MIFKLINLGLVSQIMILHEFRNLKHPIWRLDAKVIDFTSFNPNIEI